MWIPDVSSLPADPADIVPLLDDHHLVVLGDSDDERAHFDNALRRHLGQLPETVLIPVRTGQRNPVEGLCRALAQYLDDPGRLDGTVASLGAVLRDGVVEAKHEYFLWVDAGDALEADIEGFGQVVNAMMAAAAEREFVSSEVLVLQRFVFFGCAKLGAYAEEEGGQFRCWLPDADGGPSADVMASVGTPPVLTYRIDG